MDLPLSAWPAVLKRTAGTGTGGEDAAPMAREDKLAAGISLECELAITKLSLEHLKASKDLRQHVCSVLLELRDATTGLLKSYECVDLVDVDTDDWPTAEGMVSSISPPQGLPQQSNASGVNQTVAESDESVDPVPVLDEVDPVLDEVDQSEGTPF